MSICEYQAKAKAAMQMAATATCETERSDWLRVALTWQDLARVPAPLHNSRNKENGNG
jgi:hypothetical protein